MFSDPPRTNKVTTWVTLRLVVHLSQLSDEPGCSQEARGIGDQLPKDVILILLIIFSSKGLLGLSLNLLACLLLCLVLLEISLQAQSETVLGILYVWWELDKGQVIDVLPSFLPVH